MRIAAMFEGGHWVLTVQAKPEENIRLQVKTLRVIQETVTSFSLVIGDAIEAFCLDKRFVQVWLEGIHVESGEWNPANVEQGMLKGPVTGSLSFRSLPVVFMSTRLHADRHPMIWRQQ